jgi:hypothetical protein
LRNLADSGTLRAASLLSEIISKINVLFCKKTQKADGFSLIAQKALA